MILVKKKQYKLIFWACLADILSLFYRKAKNTRQTFVNVYKRNKVLPSINRL